MLYVVDTDMLLGQELFVVVAFDNRYHCCHYMYVRKVHVDENLVHQQIYHYRHFFRKAQKMRRQRLLERKHAETFVARVLKNITKITNHKQNNNWQACELRYINLFMFVFCGKINFFKAK
jgi:5'(3')-deoxyribonucleotidase